MQAQYIRFLCSQEIDPNLKYLGKDYLLLHEIFKVS